MKVLQKYANEWIVQVKDITDFVQEQFTHVKNNSLENLIVPEERVFPVTDCDVAKQLNLIE